jgi:hypothetical protein
MDSLVCVSKTDFGQKYFKNTVILNEIYMKNVNPHNVNPVIRLNGYPVTFAIIDSTFKYHKGYQITV